MKKIIFIFFAMFLFFEANIIQAAEKTEKADLPIEVKEALQSILNSTANQKTPDQKNIEFLLGFVQGQNYTPKTLLILKERDEGLGVLYHDEFQFPLSDLIKYDLNPHVPGESLYPNSVRKNFWYENSPILKDWNKIKDMKLPPETPFSTSGVEFEEITPDTNSGCYYSYNLNRQFTLLKDQKTDRTAMISVSVQAAPSSIGKKGIVVGDDKNWNYIYTPKEGSNLAMVGWAKTHVYASATVNVWTEPSPGKLNLTVFKWLKAGWSNMNVVNAEHITNGVKRYIAGFKQIMESDKRPSPKTIQTKVEAIRALSDADLDKELAAYASQLENMAKENDITNDDFVNMIKDASYAKTLDRKDKVIELIKLFMKDQIK